jgi:hypothetical protein
MKPSLFSVSPHARGGVVVFSNPDYELVNHSVRRSSTPGHFAMGVYYTPSRSKLIVAGIYGPSANDDTESLRFYQEVRDAIIELQNTFQTNNLLLAGDFNAVLAPEDSTSEHITKKRTTSFLEELIEEQHLIDLADHTNKRQHTWFRRNNNQISSRLDLILTNLPITHPKYHTKITIFDHAWVQASFGQKREITIPTLKDYVLGSDEFLISFYDLLSTKLATCAPLPTNTPTAEPTPGDEPAHEVESNISTTTPSEASTGLQEPSLNEERDNQEEEDKDEERLPMDHGLTAHNKEGRTDLHFLNDLIEDMTSIHTNVERNIRARKEKKLTDVSKRLYYLHKNIAERRGTPAQRTQDQEEYVELQRELRMDAEMLEAAKSTRIQNFYKSKNGKLNSVSFQSVKEKQPSRNINKLLYNNEMVSDPDRIIRIMQEWYEHTANAAQPQRETLSDFLEDQQLELPQIGQDLQEMLVEEITTVEVETAINQAKEISAPGPSGQTITLYKILLQEIPNILTAALNQLVFNKELAESPNFQWIKHRKVVYIPKKPDPIEPGDFRPLSMLEVLYKIPSRILARRLSETLPTIIGEHQHGFMAGKGIQEPSLLATHLIQDAQLTGQPLQLISLDIEKAFDRISHAVIIQALRAFGIPELLIQALQNYVLIGMARVEVNGRKGILITVKTGSGQGDPLSSILFLIGSEPLNRLIVAKFAEIMYTTMERVKVGAILFADDNLSPTKLDRIEQLEPLLAIYDRYTGVSGLNINLRKSSALCINTTDALIQELQNRGFATPDRMRHLGIELGKTMEDTIQGTLQKIDVKAIKRRILATSPPTDTLHRATLINSALVPLYNHVFMALPTTEVDLDPLHKEILGFLWTRTTDSVTTQKRRLVAANRLSASFDKGGLQIQHPKETSAGLRLNLIQKCYKKIVEGKETMITKIIEEMLRQKGRPSLTTHINTLGPSEWEKTSRKIMTKNRMVSLAFQSMADYLTKLEESPEDWHLAPIRGHTKFSKLLPLYPAEAATLEVHRITTVSQIFDTHLSGRIDKVISPEVMNILAPYPVLCHKLKGLAQALLKQPFHNKYACPRSNLAILANLDINLSRRYRLKNREILDSVIGVAPAYHTRIRDGLAVRPSQRDFTNAYGILRIPTITSKTRETAFQILNRTIWTNNKAFKSRMRPDPHCERCKEVETMEHLLCVCEHYSEPLWTKLADGLTMLLNETSTNEVPRVELGQLNIIFNIPHPSIKLHIQDKASRHAILLLIQEVKRDIIFRRMNLPPSAQQITDPRRLAAHLDSTIRRLCSYLQYIGLLKYKKAAEMLLRLQEHNLT